LVILSASGYLISFGSQLLVSYYFGTSSKLDGYWTALAVVNLLCFFVHPLREALVPELHKVSQLELQDKASGILSAASLLLLGLSTLAVALVLIAPDQLVSLVARHAEGVERNDIKNSLIWLLPSLWLFSFSETLNTVLTSYNRVIYQAASRILGTLATMASLALLSGHLGVSALAIGLMAGQFVTIILSLLALSNCNLNLVLVSPLYLKDGSFFTMFFSLILTYLSAQIYSVFERSVMLGLAPGLIASFQYSVNLVNVMLSIVAYPLINLLWPVFMQSVYQSDRLQLNAIVIKMAGLLAFALCTICAYSYVHSLEIIELVYLRGAFDSDSLVKTNLAFRCAIFAAVPIGLYALLVRVFLSMGESRLIAIVGIGTAISGMFILLWAQHTSNLVLAQIHWFAANGMGLILCVIMYLKKFNLIKRSNIHGVLWTAKLLISAFLPCLIFPKIVFAGGLMVKIIGLIAVFCGHCCIAILLAYLLGVTTLLGLKAPWQKKFLTAE
jgi:putative peptidoglycan lipid II flippase